MSRRTAELNPRERLVPQPVHRQRGVSASVALLLLSASVSACGSSGGAPTQAPATPTAGRVEAAAPKPAPTPAPTAALAAPKLAATEVPAAAAQPTAAPAPAQEPSAPVGLQVGQRAPAFTVTTLDGKPLSSAELLVQDKPFILYFFATW